MRKKFTMLLTALLCAFTSSVMAQTTYYRPGARTTTLEAGKQYFISVATWWNGSACTNLMYNNNGTLAVSEQLPNVTTDDATYLFTVEEKGDNKLYYIKNNQGKYLQADDLASTDTKTGVYVIQYFDGKAVCCGSDVDACDENGNKIAYNNINANTPIVTVQKNQDYTNAGNRNGWRYISGLSAGVNWCTAFAFYEAVPVVATNVLESNKVYRVINKKNDGKVIAENTPNFKLHVPDKADNDNSQLWYVEGDDVLGYTFRNLKTADYMNFVDAMYTHWETTDAPVPFYLTKVVEATEETPAYFAIALRSDAKLHEHAYAHFSNNNVVRWVAKDGEASDAAVVEPSLWQFEEVSIDASTTLNESYGAWKSTITSTIEEANALMTTAGFSISSVALTTGNTTCPAAISDNSDGGGVPALLDDDNNTFMHTKYSGKGNVGEPHYIQVDLGENNSAKFITFSYRARHDTQNNNPETIIIKGSVDGTDYTDIQTLTNLPDGLIEYESPVVGNGTAYRYFRFVVTETTNMAKHEGYVFFSLGKFRMNTVAVNDEYVSKLTVLNIMNEWINTHEIAETRPENWCFKTVSGWDAEVSELIYGATLREYPFTLTTDVNAPVCYQILSGRGNANTSYYFTLKPNDGGKVKLETNTKDNVYSYWFFMEEPATGKLIVVPFIDESNPLGYVTVADGDSKLTNVHTTQNFAGYYYEVIEYAGVNGFPYALKPYKANTNVSNHGGTSNFMGFYNGTSDGGSAVKFEEVASPALEFRSLRDAIAAANALVPGDDRIGTGLNKYSRESVDACKAEINAAGQLYNVVSTSADVLSEKITTLSNLYYEVLKINQPQAGKFYRIRCTDENRRLLSTTGEKSQGDTRLKLANTVTDESIFLYTGDALVSYQTGLYINDRRYNDVGVKSTVTFSNAHNKVLGQYNIKVGNNHIYGAGDYLDSGSGTPDNRNGYNWWLEEDNITSLSVAVSDAGYATFIAPVALEIPEGVEAYIGVVFGNYLDLNPVTGTIPANTGVVLKAAENTYNFKIVADVDPIDSDLVGSTAAKANDKKNEEEIPYYTLQSDGNGGVVFKQFNGDNLAGSKAYLDFSANPTAAQSISIRFEGTTDIEHSTLNPQPSTQIYDLLGRRVEAITKGGIYIVNGKKVVVK